MQLNTGYSFLGDNNNYTHHLRLICANMAFGQQQLTIWIQSGTPIPTYEASQGIIHHPAGGAQLCCRHQPVQFIRGQTSPKKCCYGARANAFCVSYIW